MVTTLDTSSAVRAERRLATASEERLVTSASARRWLAGLRIVTGWIFLWAFVDKTFGLGFSTPSGAAWIRGGSPAGGFLTGPGVTGPLKPLFSAIAGPVTDGLFMAGMLAIGLAVVLGIGLRISAVVGTLIKLLMYVAEWPFAPDGASTNPLVDYHIVYALALIVAAVLCTGDTAGLGRAWKALPIVRSRRWLV